MCNFFTSLAGANRGSVEPDVPICRFVADDWVTRVGELSVGDMQGAFRLDSAPYLRCATFCGVSIQGCSIVSLQVAAGRFHVAR